MARWLGEIARWLGEIARWLAPVLFVLSLIALAIIVVAVGLTAGAFEGARHVYDTAHADAKLNMLATVVIGLVAVGGALWGARIGAAEAKRANDRAEREFQLRTQVEFWIEQMPADPTRFTVFNRGVPVRIRRVQMVFPVAGTSEEHLITVPIVLPELGDGSVLVDRSEDFMLNQQFVAGVMAEMIREGFSTYYLRVSDVMGRLGKVEGQRILPEWAGVPNLPAVADINQLCPSSWGDRACPVGTRCVATVQTGAARCWCLPATCDGCCIDNGGNGLDDQCLANGASAPVRSPHRTFRTNPFVCGVGGAPCERCGHGSHSGCCSANGHCEHGNTNDACGKNGAICANCRTTGAMCEDGTCVSPRMTTSAPAASS